MTPHDNILAEVAYERRMQDVRWGGPAKDDKLMEEEWLTLILRHAGLATAETVHLSPSPADRRRFRKQMVRVAALAVAAVQAFDRLHGKVQDNTIKGSGV